MHIKIQTIDGDSWERLEKEAALPTCDYFGHPNLDCTECQVRDSENCESEKGKDVIRRAKALAGVSE